MLKWSARLVLILRERSELRKSVASCSFRHKPSDLFVKSLGGKNLQPIGYVRGIVSGIMTLPKRSTSGFVSF